MNAIDLTMVLWLSRELLRNTLHPLARVCVRACVGEGGQNGMRVGERGGASFSRQPLR